MATMWRCRAAATRPRRLLVGRRSRRRPWRRPGTPGAARAWAGERRWRRCWSLRMNASCGTSSGPTSSGPASPYCRPVRVPRRLPWRRRPPRTWLFSISGLPDVPGETVARELPAAAATPILMLTAKSAEEERIRGLELGADDPAVSRLSASSTSASLRRAATARRNSRCVSCVPARSSPQPPGAAGAAGAGAHVTPRSPRGAGSRAAAAPVADWLVAAPLGTRLKAPSSSCALCSRSTAYSP